MAEFIDRYGSDDKCEAALIESRWLAGFTCPAGGCGQNSSFRRQGLLYFQCAACRHQCSVISGTIFEATKLPLSRWFLAMHLLTQSSSRSAPSLANALPSHRRRPRRKRTCQPFRAPRSQLLLTLVLAMAIAWGVDDRTVRNVNASAKTNLYSS